MLRSDIAVGHAELTVLTVVKDALQLRQVLLRRGWDRQQIYGRDASTAHTAMRGDRTHPMNIGVDYVVWSETTGATSVLVKRKDRPPVQSAHTTGMIRHQRCHRVRPLRSARFVAERQHMLRMNIVVGSVGLWACIALTDVLSAAVVTLYCHIQWAQRLRFEIVYWRPFHRCCHLQQHRSCGAVSIKWVTQISFCARHCSG